MLKLFIGGTEFPPSVFNKIKIKRETQNYSADFSIVLDYSPNIHLAQEVQIMDSEKLVFGGIITDIDVQDYSDSAEKLILTIKCGTFKEYLNRRTIDFMLYDEAKTTDVVRNLCENLLSQEGITEGMINLNDGIEIWNLSDFDIFGQNVSQIYDKCKAMDGCEWFIDIDKKLYYGKTLKEPIFYETVIKRGANLDIRNLKISRSLDEYRNKQFFYGGQPDGTEITPDDEEWVEIPGYTVTISWDGKIRVVRQLNDEIDRMQRLSGGTGVWGNVVSNDKVTTIAEAIKQTDLLLEKYGTHGTNIEFDTFDSIYEPGNFIKVKYPEFNINTRIIDEQEVPTTFVIDSVDITTIKKDLINYHIKATERNVNATNTGKVTLTDYFKKMLDKQATEQSGLVFY